MTKADEQRNRDAREVYLVVRRIHSDALDQTHEAGKTANLSDWPEAVIEHWLERGVIKHAETRKVNRGTTK